MGRRTDPKREGKSQNLFLMVFKAPVLYAALLAVLIRVSGFSLEGTFVYPVLHHFTGAFIVLVTITIGVQLHRTHRVRLNGFMAAAATLKLILSPLLALLLISLSTHSHRSLPKSFSFTLRSPPPSCWCSTAQSIENIQRS